MKRTSSKTNDPTPPKKPKNGTDIMTPVSTGSAQKEKKKSPVRSPCICNTQGCLNAREEWKHHFPHNYNDMIRFNVPLRS